MFSSCPIDVKISPIGDTNSPKDNCSPIGDNSYCSPIGDVCLLNVCLFVCLFFFQCLFLCRQTRASVYLVAVFLLFFVCRNLRSKSELTFSCQQVIFFLIFNLYFYF